MKQMYPGVEEAEKQRCQWSKDWWKNQDDEPDFVGGAPNYDKFKGWDVDRVLTWLNID